MSGQLAVLDAEQKIARIEHFAVNIAMALRAEVQAREDRDAMLDRMVNQLIGQPNPLTEKAHSATSAEKAVKDTDDYRAAAQTVLSAECGRVLALADYERSLLNARLAVASISLEAAYPMHTVTVDMPLRVVPPKG